MSAKVKTAYLVVRPDMSLRIAARPRLASDEVSIRLRLTFPESWGRCIADLSIDMPDCPPVVELVEEPPG